ncbi:hemerythrin domain-containing protein [Streptomyces sp. NPDC017936]|uniref:hemerythrin domain-containing protein n=1 Tax=Streptomyces sp. NPDC017936 TaxID=3365016 RepID=UPI0037A16E53
MTVSITEQDAAALGGNSSILMRQRRDHAELDAMMNRYMKGGVAGELDGLWQDIVQLVFSHAFAEETVLWPVLRRVCADGEQLTTRVEQEHQAINDLVAQIERTPEDSRREEWIRQAFALISQDIRDEEDALLPCLRDTLGDRQLRRIGAAWEAARATAPTHPHPAVSRRPPGNVLSGLPLSVFDRLRDLGPTTSVTARRAVLGLGSLTAAAFVIMFARRAVRRHEHA